MQTQKYIFVIFFFECLWINVHGGVALKSPFGWISVPLVIYVSQDISACYCKYQSTLNANVACYCISTQYTG